MPRAPHFLGPALGADASTLTLYVDDGRRRLAGTVELAVDSASRRRGLLGREQLPPDAAVIIAPSNAVHTFGMRFPIDVIFAARDGRVLKVRSSVPRSRVSCSLRAFAVIEMAAGAAARAGVRRGDRLLLVAGD